MSIAHFTVRYDGEALRDHKMDVRELGPALMSIGQLFDEVNRVLNDNKVEVRLNVRATSPGSFQIDFELGQSLIHQLTTILQGDMIQSALTLKELIFDVLAGGGGLYWLIKKLKGQKPDRITDVGNGMVKIEIEGDSFIIPLKLLRLYQDLGVRNAVESTLKPLESEGVDLFEVREANKQLQTVTKEEVKYFKAPAFEDEVILEDTRQAAYSIVSLSFREDNKWRLFDGNSTINASIKDEDFLNKVESGSISFTKGDVLICDVRIVQKQTESGLKTEYEILKIVQHKSSPRQLSLLIEQEGEAGTPE